MTEQAPIPEHLRDIIPDHLGVITGWRGWKVVIGRSGIRLFSCTQEIEWLPRVPLQAICPHIAQHARLVAPAYSASKYAPQLGENLIVPEPWGASPSGSVVPNLGPQDMLWIPRAVMPPRPVVKVEPIPWDACGCGIYAKNDAKDALAYGDVLGLVALWGRVIVHENGWRAEYAYPQELYVHDGIDRQGLSRTYGVPVYPLTASRLFAAAEIGPSEPVTLKWIRRVATMLTGLVLTGVVLLIVAIVATVIHVFHLS